MHLERATPSTGSLPAAISPALATRTTQLHHLVASKPVRALVKIAKQPPRLFDNQHWMVMTMAPDLPQLDHVLGAKTIDARSVGEHGPSGGKFWSELGLDAGKLTTSIGNGFGYETQATLGFDGRIVK